MLALWFIPGTLLYMSYYYGMNLPPSMAMIGYTRFFASMLPAAVIAAAWLIERASHLEVAPAPAAVDNAPPRRRSIAAPIAAGAFVALVACANLNGTVGAMERDGQVRAQVVTDARHHTLHNFIDQQVERGSSVFTDNHRSYHGLGLHYDWRVVDHAERYVDGQVHTNRMENFWALLKRGLHGTYVSVKPFHLFRYLDERVFTFNMRELDDLGRFETVLGQVADRRLTYAELIGHA